jgi:undecaprenyl-diphosphatase
MEYYKPENESNLKWIILAVLAVLFAGNLYFILSGNSATFDADGLEFCRSIRDELLTMIATAITHCGDTIVIAVFCLILLVLPTRVRFGIPLTAAAVTAGVTQYIIKEIVERTRPDEAFWLIEADGFSFPSGHSNAGFVFYLFLMILLRRYLILNKYPSAAWLASIVFPVLVVLIGASRIYLGVHYPTDVIGGWLLGGVLLIILVNLYDTYYPLKNRLTFDPPSWGYVRRRRPWRRPSVHAHDDPLIEFPKNRSKWKRPNTTASRRAREEERRRIREERNKKD